MKTEVLSQEGNIIEIKAEYDVDEVNKTVAGVFRELSANANVKGFRKGHVPRKMLELRFDIAKIYEDTARRLANEALTEIVEEHDLSLVAPARALEIGKLAEGVPFWVRFSFEVRPEVTLPDDISSLTAERTIYSVTDEEVDEAFSQLLESNAEVVPISDDRPAEKDDIIEAEYSSFLIAPNGAAPTEIEKGKKSVMYLSNVREDIANPVVGHKPAEEFTFEITLESDYPNPGLAGKTVRYDMEILQFMKRVVPEATDEKVNELTKGKYETVDALKENIRSKLWESATERSDGTLKESALKALVEASQVEVPESMVNRQYEQMRREQNSYITSQLKQSLEEYLKSSNLNVDEYENRLRERSREIVKNSLVVDSLAERESISFEGNDLNEEIMRMAMSMGVNPQKLADAIGGNEDEMQSLIARVCTRNTIDFLASKVQVREAEPRPEKDAQSAEETTNG
ncbi:trigger factor [Synergistales bacterium]|nr:trigger factor [Synergistales bacterium]